MRFAILLYLLLFSSLTWGQSRQDENSTLLLFWNVENLFDTEDDSLTRDDEYVPYSMRAWNYNRYHQKLFHIYKTLVAIGGWQLPELVALAEVENRRVLEDLLEKTPLFRAGYQIIHQDSEDKRGIDLAILYRPERIELSDTSFIPVRFPNAPESRTRDILYVRGRIPGSETFDLYVNHWPSRYGGGRSSESKRLHVASLLRYRLDSALQYLNSRHSIVLGDFNDAPEDASLHKLAAAKAQLKLISTDNFQGTHKHQGVWSHFDQVWVSESLLKNHQLKLVSDKATVFHPDWLLESDKSYGGLKPKRTYVGYRYHGGFSDHLPVYLELNTNTSQLSERE